jgi:hypothetical protein
MPRLDWQYKSGKVLKFLSAVTDPQVFASLAQRGFTNETRREGWNLLAQAGGRDVEMTAPGATGIDVAEVLRQVDAWENEWFDVIDAALHHRYPDVHALVLQGLHKSSSQTVVLTVKVLLDRLDALESEDRMRPALALLTSRGLTPVVRARGRELLRELRAGDVTVLPTADPVAAAARVAAEAAMWEWYLDWSKTARTVVRQKALRIKLGLSAAPRGAAAAPDGAAEPPPEVTAPVAALRAHDGRAR